MFRAFLMAGSVLLASTACTGQSPASSVESPPLSATERMPDPESVDRSIDPCTDFYRFACNGWLKANPVPADQTRWRQFTKLQERNTALLYGDLERASTQPATPLQALYGNYFAACMDKGEAERDGASTLLPLFANIAALKSREQLGGLVGRLESQTGTPLFFVLSVVPESADSSRQIADLGQGVLSLGTRDTYISSEASDVRTRQGFIEHMRTMFLLLGDTDQQARAEANSVLRIETTLAQAAVPDSVLFDPAQSTHSTSVAQLSKLAPGFAWGPYLQAIGESALRSVNVENLSFYTQLSKLAGMEDLPALRSYIRWQLLTQYAPLMGGRFRQENFNFFRKTLGGQQQPKPQWLACTEATDRSLGEAVGQDWVRENFPPDAKIGMERMVASLHRALGEQIQQLDWMSPETKAEAEAKLTHLQVMIGYPDHRQSYAGLKLSRTDAVRNQIAVDARAWRRELSKIGQPVDRKEWFNTPPTVNAYTFMPGNQSVFPAGILQPPFFDPKGDPATNYGAIGSIIGHEMTHGFDNNGSKLDALGTVRNWWQPEDLAHFKAASACIEKQYGEMEVVPGLKQNGKLTLPENIADNGGLLIAFKALLSSMAEPEAPTVAPQLDGFTPEQRFFIGFAQSRCDNQTEQDIRQRVRTDPHSEDVWRVDGTVANMPQFGAAFSCKEGAAEAPTSRCSIW